MRDEQAVRAYLEVVYKVTLFVRSRSSGENRLSDEHLHDLMDAIHNVPAFIIGKDQWFTPERMREWEFGDYDAKWSDHGGLHLVRLLEEAESWSSGE